ncbi:MAG: hypothetical protein KF878_12275 [Planctomycetes bacterium]|nr:hypothetical protein [Planctomycetota bacterium]
MAEDDARGNVLRSLGVSRRRPDAAGDAAGATDEDAAGDGPADAAGEQDGGADPAPADEAPADDAPAEANGEPKAVSGLGIKRRRPPTAERPAAADPDAPASPASTGGGLGITRRKPGAAPEQAAPASSKPANDADKAEGPARRPLGNDQVAVILANYFRGRPGLELPPRVYQLKRTHGFYTGDGRPERKLTVGFEPALVLYVIPVYPEEIWPTFTKDYKPIDPGLHRQPKFVADGFVVDAPYNILGEGYIYVAFRSDGQPLELPGPSGAQEPAPEAASLGLGIRRRK